MSRAPDWSYPFTLSLANVELGGDEVGSGVSEALTAPASRTTPCLIKFAEIDGRTEWDVAGDPRKYDSGGSVYYAR